MSAAIRPRSLDHVALWIADARKPLATFLCDHLGHARDRGDGHLHARRRGRQARQADAVRRRRAARARRARAASRCGCATSTPRWPAASEAAAQTAEDGTRPLRAPGAASAGGRRGATGRTSTSTTWSSALPDPEASARALESMGFERRDGGLAVADRELRVEEGRRAEGERPLLNHLALLVESADEVQREAEQRGVEVADSKDAPNTLAVFVRGPSRRTHRVRRAQAGLRPGLSRCRISSSPAPAWPASWRPPSARRLGAQPVVFEKLDRPGGSMRLSSGVVWRHRDFERFRAECPGGDERLQRVLFERLDDGPALARVARRAGRRARDRQPADDGRSLRRPRA